MAEEDRGFAVVQDFYSKKAVAHASFLVASMFGLFTILAFAERTLGNPPSYLNFFLLAITYWSIWVFGLYSMFNFSLYATMAQHAERHAAMNEDDQVKDEVKKSSNRILKPFVDFKMASANEKIKFGVRSHFDYVFLVFYVLIGILPFLALVFTVFH
jgi:phosphotransferase system  glucose/maltose/N-acetylglucosamine-specific IIC component